MAKKKYTQEELRLRKNARQNEKNANMSPEERGGFNAKQKAKRANMSPEEREEYNARRRDEKANRTPEKKEADRLKINAQQKARHANMSDEKRAEHNAKSIEYNKSIRTHYVTYLHKDSKGSIIYVGSGDNMRPYQNTDCNRSKEWLEVFGNEEPIVEIVFESKFKSLCLLCEHMQINIIGIENLINKRQGLDISTYQYIREGGI